MLKHRINYPIPVEAVAPDGEPLWLWAPSPVVEAAERLLPRNSRIVDLGAGRGANGMFLAMQGHEVISVESSAQTVREGQQIARALGSTVMTHRFVRADMRELDLATEFGPQDAILAIRSLQQVSMAEAETAVATMQAATTPGGLNAVQAYIARPDQKPSLPHLALFEPGQLEATYQQAGWETAHRESQLHELDYSMGLPQCRSTTQLITVKPTA